MSKFVLDIAFFILPTRLDNQTFLQNISHLLEQIANRHLSFNFNPSFLQYIKSSLSPSRHKLCHKLSYHQYFQYMAGCSESTAETYDAWRKLLIINLTWFILVLGTTTNSLTIMLLGKQFLNYIRNSNTAPRSDRVPFILVSLAVCDILTIYSKGIVDIIQFWFGIPIYEANDFCCRFCNTINYTLGDFSIWLVPYLTFERLCLLWLPIKSRVVFTLKSTAVSWTLILFLVLSKNVSMPFAFTSKVVNTTNGVLTRKCVVNSEAPIYYFYISGARDMMANVTVAILPVSLVVTCNILIIYKWRMTILKARILIGEGQQSRQSGLESKQLPLILATSVAYFCFLVPFFAFGGASTLFPKDRCSQSLKNLIYDAFAGVFYLNHSTNFFFYVIFSRSYRMKLNCFVARITCCFNKASVAPASVSISNQRQ